MKKNMDRTLKKIFYVLLIIIIILSISSIFFNYSIAGKIKETTETLKQPKIETNLFCQDIKQKSITDWGTDKGIIFNMELESLCNDFCKGFTKSPLTDCSGEKLICICRNI